MAPMAAAPEGSVKQAEPEKEDIMVMDTKLKIIEILQVTISRGARSGAGTERRHASTERQCPALVEPRLRGRGRG